MLLIYTYNSLKLREVLERDSSIVVKILLYLIIFVEIFKINMRHRDLGYFNFAVKFDKKQL